jgi:hypothetical protein
MRPYATLGRCSSGASARSLKTYPRGRVCGENECDTVLSSYNPSSFCALHDRPVSPTRRTSRPVSELVCEHCGTAFETSNPQRRYCSDCCRMAAFARRKRATEGQGGVAAAGLPGRRAAAPA